MDRQEIYNQIQTHLLTQNQKSLMPNGKGAYRGLAGLKCALGIFIPDELYSLDLEGKSVKEISAFFRFPNGPIENCQDMSFLFKLQDIHDGCPIENWETALESLAYEFSLVP